MSESRAMCDDRLESSYNQELTVQIGPRLRTLILPFLDKMGYKTPESRTNAPLWHAMIQRASQIGISLDDRQSQRCFECGFTYAAICFPGHPLNAQVYTGIHTWLGTLIDDSNELRDDIVGFGRRFHSGEAQPNKLLQGYANILRSTYLNWDPITAEFIVLSSLAFINCNILEERPEFQKMAPTQECIQWTEYFREREGVPEAYSYFTFPEATCPDFSQFLQAIPDMCKVLNLANDVLSFYKEEIAGERKNYIHHRARYEGKDVFSVLKDAADECVRAAKRVETVLEGKIPCQQAWMCHLNGYLHMHMSIARYRLTEIRLSEEPRCTIPLCSQEKGNNE